MGSYGRGFLFFALVLHWDQRSTYSFIAVEVRELGSLYLAFSTLAFFQQKIPTIAITSADLPVIVTMELLIKRGLHEPLAF